MKKIEKKKVAVVAFGGNALIRSGERGSMGEQLKNADAAAGVLVKLVRRGYELVLVHGNGPQVGHALIRSDAAIDTVPPIPLYLCVSETQGSMGFLLETAISNRLKTERIHKQVINVSTRVVVDRNDPAFDAPSKPIGPFFTEARARRLMEEHDAIMVEDSGRGWRQVVASPRPKNIVEISVISHLVSEGNIVIACGGGGIPVVEGEGGALRGIDAVIDKDYAASLVARAIMADLFVILTEVSHVCINFGAKNEKKLKKLSLIDAIDYYRDGQFPKGSMGPKVEAAIDYLMNGGKEALITSANSLEKALAGSSGTYIIRSESGFVELQPRIDK